MINFHVVPQCTVYATKFWSGKSELFKLQPQEHKKLRKTDGRTNSRVAHQTQLGSLHCRQHLGSFNYFEQLLTIKKPMARRLAQWGFHQHREILSWQITSCSFNMSHLPYFQKRVCWRKAAQLQSSSARGGSQSTVHSNPITCPLIHKDGSEGLICAKA